jgi:hypothetical protein
VKMGAEAISASDILVKSPGIPAHWETLNATPQSVGLASSANVLSDAKLKKFTEMRYAEAREALGLEHQFYFYVEDVKGNRLYEGGNTTVGEQAVSVARFALLDGEKVILRMVVHE